MWCLMVRHAVLTGELPAFEDIEPWVPHGRWNHWSRTLQEAKADPPQRFTANAWAGGALQAAWSAITHTPVPDGPDASGHLVDSLTTAIWIGHDTDDLERLARAIVTPSSTGRS